MGSILSKPKAPKMDDSAIRAQEAAQAAREKQLQAEQNKATQDVLRRRRGGRSLMADYATTFGTTDTLG